MMRARLSRGPILVPLLALVLVAPGATTPLVGCAGEDAGGGRACTEIGCSDGVTFVVARGALDSTRKLVARACLDGTCKTHRLSPEMLDQAGGVALDAWFAPDTLDPSREHEASLTIREGRRAIFGLERAVTLETSQPNGPGCPPTCHSATVRIDAADVRAYSRR